MRIGTFISDTGGARTEVGELRELARWAEDSGFTTAWVPHLPWGLDALVALCVAGQVTSRIELGSAVTPTYPVHPMSMARSALSVNAAIGGRLALGIGPSHPSVIENMHGLRYDRPAQHTREYVQTLRSAFAGTGQLDAHGEFFDFASMFSVPGQREPVLLIAALAPLMLKLAGELTDGTILWFADEHAIETHVVPRITAAASAAGRPAPRVIAPLPVALCDEAEGRERAAHVFAAYTQIPTYQRILARGAEGASPAELVLVGDEAAIERRLRRFAAAGVTDFVAAPFPVGDDRGESMRRTRDFLAGLAPEIAP
jgi:F420-dependent oxidoreductase-like protein